MPRWDGDAMGSLFPGAPSEEAKEPERRVWTVSGLTQRIRGTLEDEIGRVWVEGEISNFRTPGSGHAYFTLKDENSQLRAVMFRRELSSVTVPLKDGLQVRGYGLVTAYPAGGSLQIVLSRLEPAGEGELMLRLAKLKKKLATEGLFDADKKQPLPLLPQHVGLVTSPTGAAIRDILQVLNRRFANLHVLLAPVRVQGAGAAEEIAAAIDRLNERGGLDVLIVGRGGGSLEDLWCFNEEVVVRAIARSRIPVISAVGHEIDTTLSDYAADVRVPTPSAAAEIVVQGKADLERRVNELQRRMVQGTKAAVLRWHNRLDRAARTPGLKDPLRSLQQRFQQVDVLALRIQNALAGLPRLVRQRTEAADRRMATAARGALLQSVRRRDVLQQRLSRALAGLPREIHLRLDQATRRTGRALSSNLDRQRHQLDRLQDRLRMLNPRAVLGRGYTLTRLAGGALVRSAADAPPGTRLETEFADGTVISTVNPSAEGESHGNGSE